MIMTTTPRIPLPPGALKAEDWQPDGKRLLRGTKRGEGVHIDICPASCRMCDGCCQQRQQCKSQDL